MWDENKSNTWKYRRHKLGEALSILIKTGILMGYSFAEKEGSLLLFFPESKEIMIDNIDERLEHGRMWDYFDNQSNNMADK